jgi:hypothetical protein
MRAEREYKHTVSRKSHTGGVAMETYRFYPPQMLPAQVPYQVVDGGVADCEHELLEDEWCNRIFVEDGIVFVAFSCKHCGRQILQSLEEVSPPASWKGGNWSN